MFHRLCFLYRGILASLHYMQLACRYAGAFRAGAVSCVRYKNGLDGLTMAILFTDDDDHFYRVTIHAQERNVLEYGRASPTAVFIRWPGEWKRRVHDHGKETPRACISKHIPEKLCGPWLLCRIQCKLFARLDDLPRAKMSAAATRRSRHKVEPGRLGRPRPNIRFGVQ